MKKTIITTIILTTLMLSAISNIAKADILNPVTKAEVQSFFKSQARVVYALEVCESDLHIPTFKKIMDAGYLMAGATDQSDKMIVDMMWPALWSLDDPNKSGMTTPAMVKGMKQLKKMQFDQYSSICKDFETTVAKSYK